MNIPSLGVRGRDRFLLSLSGGGYRAALFCAGALRAFYEVGWLDPSARVVLISATSGGAIAAYLWDLFLQTPEEWRQANPSWPENRLLDLIAQSPRFGGRAPWWLRLRLRPSWWKSFLSRWCEQTERLAPRSDGKGNDAAVLIAVLDFELGDILTFNRGSLFRPTRETFKTGELWHSIGGYSSAHCLAAATAVPFYFPAIPAIVSSTIVGKYVTTLVDAGVVDNASILPFMPLVRLDGTGTSLVDKRDSWLLLDAGRPLSIPRKPGYLDYNFRPVTDKLRLPQRLSRVTGDLAQPLFLMEIMTLIRERIGVNMWGTKLGWLNDAMWYSTKRLASPEALALVPTTVNRLAREDCLALVIHGAQCAAQLFEPDAAGKDQIAFVKHAAMAMLESC